ncbi:MAG: hypothetical protein L0387_07820 [Acidobacteria bacterium]|nr:hypothetical protein [Acidobacteriota bacterium]MCI0719852.1 hypothetical protein [Acidobacteriota bacterium]
MTDRAKTFSTQIAQGDPNQFCFGGEDISQGREGIGVEKITAVNLINKTGGHQRCMPEQI